MLINRRTTNSGVTVIELYGNFDLADKTAFIEATKGENQKLVINLAQLDHITLEGVQTLANLAIVAGKPVTNVVFVEPLREQVVQKLSTTGMTQCFSLFANEVEATKALLFA